MNDRTRRAILYAAGLATILAAIFAPPAEEPVQPARFGAASAAPHDGLMDAQDAPRLGSLDSTASPRTLLPQKRDGLLDEPVDLFMVERPPAPVKAVFKLPKAIPPTAPALPYSYMGKMVEGGEVVIFLTRQDKPYVVHGGDVLDAQWRVDVIQSSQIEFTYLPLQQKQIMSIGALK